MADPDTQEPSPEIADIALLRLFGFSKSLEEIDDMDIGRLMRALETGNLQEAWRRWHERDYSMNPGLKFQDGKLVSELKRLLHAK